MRSEDHTELFRDLENGTWHVRCLLFHTELTTVPPLYSYNSTISGRCLWCGGNASIANNVGTVVIASTSCRSVLASYANNANCVITGLIELGYQFSVIVSMHSV